MTELANDVRLRAGDRCEYCLIPQAAFRRSFHLEHVVARQHGGISTLENLALACWQCNLKKGPNLTGLDPEGGKLTPLFHPRTDSWPHHFAVQICTRISAGLTIAGLTPAGRATVHVLGMNDEMRQMLRYELWLEGKYAGPDAGAP